MVVRLPDGQSSATNALAKLAAVSAEAFESVEAVTLVTVEVTGNAVPELIVPLSVQVATATGMMVKLAVTVALPDVSFTVVDAELALVMVAVPEVTSQPAKEYPLEGVTVMVVEALWLTVTGELAGAVRVPPLPATTESE